MPSSNHPGFEPGVDAPTRRALFDLRRRIRSITGLRIVGTIPTPGPPSAPGDQPGDIIIDSDGNGWSWDGDSWTNIGPIQGPPGPPGEDGAGSGFTYVQETRPTATEVGETWYNNATALSFVWVDNFWVQFAPGGGGGSGGGGGGDQVLAYVHNQGTPEGAWLIDHNLGWHPNVLVIDSTGTVVEGDVVQVTSNQLRLDFSGAFTGTAYLS